MMKKLTARVPKPATPRELPTRDTRTAYVWKGRMLASIVTKPIGHTLRIVLVLLASHAFATTSVITAPQGGAQVTMFPFSGGGGGGLGATVTNPPFNADETGAADSTAAINAATLSKSTTGGTVNFPAGIYTITSRIKVYSGMVLQGEGCSFDGTNWRGSVIKMTGSGGYSGIGNATPATCTGGAGSCATTIGAGTKGAGCACYVNGDCTSGVCTNGTSVRGVVIRNLCVQIQVDHAIGVDLTGLNESDVYDLFIFADATGATDTMGVLASDVNGAFSGYSNSIHNIRLGGTAANKVLTFGVRVLPQANNTTIREIRVQGNTATGIQTDDDAAPFTVGQPALNAHIIDNSVETFTTEGIRDRAKGTQIEGNYCESGGALGLPCLHLSDGTSVQIGYNFFTPSNLTQPVLFDGVTTTPVQWNNESNVVDTAKWSNQYGGFDFQDFDFQPRGVAAFTCISSVTGRVYYSNVQHTLCSCDTWNGTLKWCPVVCRTDTAACPAGFVCGAGQTSTTCG